MTTKVPSPTVEVDELDDLFHFCAFRAFVEQSVIEGPVARSGGNTRPRLISSTRTPWAEKN